MSTEIMGLQITALQSTDNVYLLMRSVWRHGGLHNTHTQIIVGLCENPWQRYGALYIITGITAKGYKNQLIYNNLIKIYLVC